MRLSFTEAIRLSGLVVMTAYEGDVEYDDDGRILNPIVFRQVKRNLIVTVGKGMLLDRLYGLGAVLALTNTGIGTSGTAAALTDTGLTGAAWKGFDATPTRSGLTVTSTTTFGTADGNGINIQELALSNGSPATAAGTILNRLAPIGPFNKTSATAVGLSVAITGA